MGRNEKAVFTALYCMTFNEFTVGFSFYHIPPPPIFHPPPSEAAVCRAWTCHGTTNRDLVNKLSSANIIRSKEVRSTLLGVDRADYVRIKERAYDDAPSSIGLGQTISAPHMHARALEELLPPLKKTTDDVKVLDVGCGSGFLTASLARMLDVMGLRGTVYGIDYLPELVRMSETNIEKSSGDLISSGKVRLGVGDGWKGLPSAGPFDIIHVGAAAETLPKELCLQLKVGGRMVCPVEAENGYQVLYRIDRIRPSVDGRYHENDFQIEGLMDVIFVPLVHP